MVVADQRALVGRADLPVPPDRGGQGQQSLGDSDPDPGKGAAAVAFQPKLALEGLESALDPLPEAAQRPQPAGLIGAVGTQQPGAMVGDELVELATGKALPRPADPSQERPR